MIKGEEKGRGNVERIKDKRKVVVGKTGKKVRRWVEIEKWRKKKKMGHNW